MMATFAVGVLVMPSRAMVRNLKAKEAFELRAKIASLEEEQRRRVACSAGMLKLAQVGQELKWLRLRLAILEDCVAALSAERRLQF